MRRSVSLRRPTEASSPGPTGLHHRGLKRTTLQFGLSALLIAVLVVALLWQRGAERLGAPGSGPVHVHGLGVNPADGALFIATHTGLFRSAQGQRRSTRVGDRLQDTMGFTIVGPDRFLGSGHPDLRDDLPPLLGLVESTDGGASWKPVSLLGEADFHVLRSAGERLFGYDATNDRLLASSDRGRTWRSLTRPGPILDIAVDPESQGRLIASADSQLGLALFQSTTGGETWAPWSSVAGLLAWPASDRLYIVTGDGEVFRSGDAGRSLDLRGRIDGRPAALLAQGRDDLYVALHDGTIQQSDDGGSTWTVRSTP
jgi:hypothetical protein